MPCFADIDAEPSDRLSQRAQGMTGAGAHFARWLSQVPSELSGPLRLTLPGTPHSRGTDHASFLRYGVPFR